MVESHTAPVRSGVIRPSIRLYRNHWTAFLTLEGFAFAAACGALLLLATGPPWLNIAGAVLLFVVHLWLRGALAVLTLAIARGTPMGPLAAGRSVLGKPLVLLATAAVPIAAGTLAGLCLLVIPGVVFYAFFGLLYAPIVVNERIGGLAALRRCREITMGRGGTIVWQWIALLGLAVVAGAAAGMGGEIVGAILPPVRAIANLLVAAFTSAVALLFAIWRGVFYLDSIGETVTIADRPAAIGTGQRFGVLLFLLLVAIINDRTIIQAFWIPSGAMEPTIQIGDHIFVNRLAYDVRLPIVGTKLASVAEIRRGDVVVFVSPVDGTTMLVKRVAAVGGDRVEIRNKQLLVNDQRVAEPYAQFLDPHITPDPPRDFFGPVQVPAGKIFVLGDNRDKSYDGRFYGFADVDEVLGRSTRIYWSWDKAKNRVRWERIGQRIE